MNLLHEVRRWVAVKLIELALRVHREEAEDLCKAICEPTAVQSDLKFHMIIDSSGSGHLCACPIGRNHR